MSNFTDAKELSKSIAILLADLKSLDNEAEKQVAFHLDEMGADVLSINEIVERLMSLGLHLPEASRAVSEVSHDNNAKRWKYDGYLYEEAFGLPTESDWNRSSGHVARLVAWVKVDEDEYLVSRRLVRFEKTPAVGDEYGREPYSGKVVSWYHDWDGRLCVHVEFLGAFPGLEDALAGDLGFAPWEKRTEVPNFLKGSEQPASVK